jgi:siroheme synthase (precorrin-2 oxidase/ferrochelatase)
MSGVRVTVATGGVAPSVAKRLREDLEAVLGDARLARMMAELARLRAALPPGERGDAVRARAEGLRLEARLVLPAWAEGEDPVERAPD